MLLSTKLKLDRLGKQLVDQLAHNIATIDTGQYLPASHRENMAATVSYELDDKEFRLVGGEFIWTYEIGRGPTVNMGNGAVRRYVREYIREEGIQPKGQKRNGMPVDEDTLAYFVSRRIHESGSKPWREKRPTGVISDIVNDRLVVKVEDLLSESYTSEIAAFLLKATA